MYLRTLVTLSLLTFACNGDDGKTTPTEVDGDTDTDSDTDTDTDSDTDTDTDSDTDTDTDTDTDPHTGATGTTGLTAITGLTGVTGDTSHTGSPLACADFDVIAVPDVVTGDTTGLPDGLAGGCGGTGAPEQLVSFVAPADGRYVFDTAGTTFDAVVYVLPSCTSPDVFCTDTLPPVAESFYADLLAGDSLVVVIDGYQAGEEGAWTLTIAQPPPNELDCADDRDEDLDLVADCADADCAADAACQPTCPDGVLTALVPAVGNTIGDLDEVTPTCGVSASSDQAFEFTAPSPGDWAFSTLGSGYDTVLALYDVCGGTELSCNDDFGGFTTSLVQRTMTAGESVIVAVDGYATAAGPFSVVAFPVLGAEVCGNGVDDDLLNGADCLDAACDLDPSCIEDCTNTVDDDLNGLVDCADLDCAADAACVETCPQLVLAGLSVAGDLTGLANNEAASCGGGSGRDETIEVTAPVAGRYLLEVTPDEPFQTFVVAVLDGCGGSELACEPFGQAVVDLTSGQVATVVVDGASPLDEGGYTLSATLVASTETTCDDFVDEDFDGLMDCGDDDCDADPGCVEDCANGTDDDGDGFPDCLDSFCATEPGCAVTCPDDTATGASTRTGSTVGQPSSHEPSCGSSRAPDHSVEFTAPNAGTWVFDTLGSDFDTVLWVLDGCGGTELACNDQSGFSNTSSVQLDLTAGQTVLLGVDGWATTGQGDFTLHAFPLQATETSCFDGFDNDADGDDDCLDTECAGDPGCQEVCTGAADEDRDGAFDCLDSDCSADPSCNPVCPDTVLAGAGTVSGDLLGRPDGLDLSCNALVGTSDATVEFTAVNTARHHFAIDPVATDFTAALGAYDTCGGAELACDVGDPFGGTVDASFVLDLTAGDTIVLAVDDATLFGTGQGGWKVDVSEVPSAETVCDDGLDEDFDGGRDCRDADCAGSPECLAVCPEQTLAAPGVFAGDTTGLSDDFTPSCSTSTAGEETIAFTAATAARYVFETTGSTFDTALTVLDGCAGAELACDDLGITDRVEVDLAAGQTVVVVVDGYQANEGAYTLTVTELVPGVCPFGVLSNVLPATASGTTAGATDDNAPTCAVDGGAPDHTYEFTATVAGNYTFDTFGSTFDTALTALDGCGGAVLACNDDAVGLQSEITVALAAGQTIVLVVDGYNTASGSYTLHAN